MRKNKFFMRRLVYIAFIFFTATAFAKPPSAMLAYPAGGQAGTTFKAIIGALDSEGSSSVVVSGEGVKAKIIAISEMPEDRQKAAARRDEAKGMKFIEVEFSIDPKAKEGLRTLRISNQDGASNGYFFYVGALPEINEAKEHASISGAHEISKLPCTINGQIYEGERDFYKFTLQKGKTYVFDVKARRIRPYLADAVPGWFQAVARLYDEKGETLAYADDYQNSPDPTLIYTPKENITCFLEVRDALFRGRDDFVYRIDAGILPHIEAIFPCGGNENETTKIEILGVNLPAASMEISKQKGADSVKEISLQNKGILSNSRSFVFDTLPERVIESSDNAPAEFTEIPCVLNGRFLRPYDKFWVRFKAKKGDSISFDVLSARLGYPADARLALYKTPNMAQLASNDDANDPSYGLVTAQFDPRINHTFKEDGDYLLKLDESRNAGGDDYVFRLKISEAQKGISVSVSPANPQIAKGNYAPLRINTIKRGGWDGEIEIVAKDLPKGFSIEKCVVKPKEDSTFVILKASDNAEAKTFTPSLAARAVIDGKQIEIPVMASEELTQAFFINHAIPVERVNVALMNKAPFRIEWGADLPEEPIGVNAGNTETLNMRIIRDPGFKGRVRIAAYRGMRGLTVLPTAVKPEETEFKIQIKGNPNAIGQITEHMFITAYAQKGNQNFMYVSPPLQYRVYGKSDLKLTK